MKSKKGNLGSQPDQQPSLVICDWGSSHLRTYLVDAEGSTLRRYESNRGVKSNAGNKSIYREELNKALEKLQVSTDSEIRISGMAGSKLGWEETDYSPTPVTKEEFASNYLPLSDFVNARLYGGVKHQNKDGSLDVMRGEEVQIFGIIAANPDARLICLPGTHSKWVTVENGKIMAFKTYMTGDLFHSLCEESIFKGQITSRTFNRDGFLHGCRLATEGNDLQDLFKLRSEYVFSKISSEAFHSCLSGFLIMNELKSANPQSKVSLCGSPSLIPLYAVALEEIGIQNLALDSETATISGHQSLISL